jgi:hypothetical protein
VTTGALVLLQVQESRAVHIKSQGRCTSRGRVQLAEALPCFSSVQGRAACEGVPKLHCVSKTQEISLVL